jgi:hypothetical protein
MLTCRSFLTILLLVICTNIKAQQCNCAENYVWLTKMISVNYPGFKDKTVFKNAQGYKQFTDSLYLKVRQQQDPYECYLSLRSYIRYFKDPHLSLNFNYTKATHNQIQ